MLTGLASLVCSTLWCGDATPLTSRDLFKLQSVVGATISPDGAYVVYELAVPRDPLGGKDGPGFVELHVVGPDGKSRPYLTGEVNVGQVEFLPSGRSLLFVAKRGTDKSRSLYTLPLDGGEARKVYEHESDVGVFSVHPTLRRVAFLATPPNPAKKERDAKGFSQEVFEEDWSSAHLYLVELDVPGAKPREIAVQGHPSDVKWSPDGKYLVVTVAPDPGVDSSYMRKKLHVFDSTTGLEASVVETKGKLGGASISPSGTTIAFVGAQTENDPQPGRLEVASTLGGYVKELLPGFLGHVTSCAWASDDTIVYVADRGCETLVGRIGADGSKNQELLVEPGFVVAALSLAKDGRHAALVAHTPNSTPELYSYELGGAKKKLTDHNAWLAQRRLAAQEVFKYKARDGLDLEGVLVHPLGHAIGAKVDTPFPLVLIVHGGPEAHNRNGWVTRYSEPSQVLAAQGYAVFLPNYRGSTGRGVGFSQLDHKDPAGKEFDDVVDAADALAASGLVDKKRVGVTGGSYGGYASAWCATKLTDRFAAAVMGFGVSDLFSMIGTSDIPDENYLVHHRVHPWEDWQLFLDRSPIKYAKDSKTPILILCGKADPRVPPTQSVELYRYLEITDHKQVRLVEYPGEGHGNSRAASRLDYHLRLLQWFDLYLKGPGGDPPPMDLDYKTLIDTKAAATVAPSAAAAKEPPAPTNVEAPKSQH